MRPSVERFAPAGPMPTFEPARAKEKGRASGPLQIGIGE